MNTAPPIVRRWDDVGQFRQRVWPFLLERECEHCVQIGLLERLSAGKPILGSTAPPLMISIEQSDRPRMVVLQTPPHQLSISNGDAESAIALAKHLAQSNWKGPVRGPSSFIEGFVRAYVEHGGARLRRIGSLRVFQLDRVIDPRPAPGEMARATAADTELAARWTEAFGDEVGLPRITDPVESARRAIEEGGLFFWKVNGQPVALTGAGSATPNGIRINRVYTPPDQRGHGYASNLVAAVSRLMLQQGRRFCFLFTDVANPTSNHIYQQIGYRAVADSENWDVVK